MIALRERAEGAMGGGAAGCTRTVTAAVESAEDAAPVEAARRTARPAAAPGRAFAATGAERQAAGDPHLPRAVMGGRDAGLR